MDDLDARFVGKLLFGLLVGGFFLYFLLRTLSSITRSERLANGALVCGLTAFCAPELILGLTPVENRILFRAIGVTRVLLSVAGLLLGILALWYRRRDQGTGMVRPLVGSGFSIVNTLVGAGYLLLTSAPYLPSPDPAADSGTAWVYEDPKHGFRLRFPSDRWREVQTKQGVSFRHRQPEMHVGIFAVQRGTTEAAFRAAVTKFRDSMEQAKSRTAPLEPREGASVKGNPYAYFTTMDQTEDGKPVFLAGGVIWCKDKELFVHLGLEGMPLLRSELGKSSELHTFETSAETIFLSTE